LVGKPEWKGPLGRPKAQVGENIRMDLTEIVDWIYLAQGSCTRGNEPSGSTKSKKFLD
jgi:hypothetical protein